MRIRLFFPRKSDPEVDLEGRPKTLFFPSAPTPRKETEYKYLMITGYMCLYVNF